MLKSTFYIMLLFPFTAAMPSQGYEKEESSLAKFSSANGLLRLLLKNPPQKPKFRSSNYRSSGYRRNLVVKDKVALSKNAPPSSINTPPAHSKVSPPPTTISAASSVLSPSVAPKPSAPPAPVNIPSLSSASLSPPTVNGSPPGLISNINPPTVNVLVSKGDILPSVTPELKNSPQPKRTSPFKSTPESKAVPSSPAKPKTNAPSPTSLNSSPPSLDTPPARRGSSQTKSAPPPSQNNSPTATKPSNPGSDTSTSRTGLIEEKVTEILSKTMIRDQSIEDNSESLSQEAEEEATPRMVNEEVGSEALVEQAEPTDVASGQYKDVSSEQAVIEDENPQELLEQHGAKDAVGKEIESSEISEEPSNKTLKEQPLEAPPS